MKARKGDHLERDSCKTQKATTAINDDCVQCAGVKDKGNTPPTRRARRWTRGEFQKIPYVGHFKGAKQK